jgi:hypothetical protein
VRSVRSEYGHPGSCRQGSSPIALAGIAGYARSSSRIRGSKPSATDPFGARSYFGGPSDRSAARTVFRETFMTRDLPDRQPLGLAEPADLCPALHLDHQLPPWLGLGQDFGKKGDGRMLIVSDKAERAQPCPPRERLA